MTPGNRIPCGGHASISPESKPRLFEQNHFLREAGVVEGCDVEIDAAGRGNPQRARSIPYDRVQAGAGGLVVEERADKVSGRIVDRKGHVATLGKREFNRRFGIERVGLVL